MSSPFGGGTNHDAESGQPLVAAQGNAAPNGSVLRGPVATSTSAAGQALAGLQKAARAVRGPAQHAGFELVRSADGELKHGDIDDDERDATGMVPHLQSVMLVESSLVRAVSSAFGDPEPPHYISRQFVGTYYSSQHRLSHALQYARLPHSYVPVRIGANTTCLACHSCPVRWYCTDRRCVAVQAGGSPRSRRACCRACSSRTAMASSPWAPARSWCRTTSGTYPGVYARAMHMSSGPGYPSCGCCALHRRPAALACYAARRHLSSRLLGAGREGCLLVKADSPSAWDVATL